MKLTTAQKREYEILKEYKSCTITNHRRNKIYLELVKKGLAFQNIHGHNQDCWFGLVIQSPMKVKYGGILS